MKFFIKLSVDDNYNDYIIYTKFYQKNSNFFSRGNFRKCKRLLGSIHVTSPTYDIMIHIDRLSKETTHRGVDLGLTS